MKLINSLFAVSSLFVSSFAFGVTMPFELPWMNHETAGTTYKSADHPQAVYVLEFFANFCGACNDNAPTVDRYVEKYKDQPNVQVLDTGVDKSATEYASWISRHKPNHPVLNGRLLWDELKAVYGFRFIPQAVVMNCKGEVLYVPEAGTWSLSVTKEMDRVIAEELAKDTCKPEEPTNP